MQIDLQRLTIDDDLNITKEDILNDLKGSFKRIEIDGVHVADVLLDDYNQYENVTGKDPIDAIKKICKEDLPMAKMMYPDQDDVDLVGFIFSEKLYKAIKKKQRQVDRS